MEYPTKNAAILHGIPIQLGRGSTVSADSGIHRMSREQTHKARDDLYGDSAQKVRKLRNLSRWRCEMVWMGDGESSITWGKQFEHLFTCCTYTTRTRRWEAIKKMDWSQHYSTNQIIGFEEWHKRGESCSRKLRFNRPQQIIVLRQTYFWSTKVWFGTSRLTLNCCHKRFGYCCPSVSKSPEKSDAYIPDCIIMSVSRDMLSWNHVCHVWRKLSILSAPFLS